MASRVIRARVFAEICLYDHPRSQKQIWRPYVNGINGMTHAGAAIIPGLAAA